MLWQVNDWKVFGIDNSLIGLLPVFIANVLWDVSLGLN